MTHHYDQAFMAYAASSSRYSAERIVPLVLAGASVSSVLDVGCAAGTWLAVWHRHGVSEIHGIDGHYVRAGQLEIPLSEFSPFDLAADIDLGRQFDLVQSLEVAEHVAPERADAFVANLARHSRGMVLFSAAPPGQGGEHHVNEQPYDYWRSRFAAHGYIACDYVRLHIARDRRVSFWYRYNMLAYVREDRLGDYPDLAATRLPDDEPIPDIAPLPFRARKHLVSLLPDRVQRALAKFKAHALPSGRI